MKPAIAFLFSLIAAPLALAFPAGSDVFSSAPALLNVSNDTSDHTSLATFTAQPSEPSIAGVSPFRSAWWTWRPEADGLAVIEVLPSPITPPSGQVLCGVFTGTTVSNLSNVAGGLGVLSQGGVRLYVPVSVSTTYHIKADSGSPTAALVLRIRLISRTAGSYTGVMSSFELGKNRMVQVTRTATGAFTAKVRTPSATMAHRGRMNAFGQAYLPMPGSSFDAPRFVEVDFAGVSVLPCLVETSGERSELKLYPHQILSAKSPTPTAGYYTAGLDMLVGAGFFTGRISTTGSVKWAGRTIDGTPFTVGSRVASSMAGSNIVPLFAALHRGKGALAMIVQVENNAPNHLGNLEGIYNRPPAPGAVFLPAGLSLSIVNLYGGRYTPPQPGQRAMNFRQSSNGAGVFYVNSWGMELANTIQENFNFGTNNKFTFSNQTLRPALVLNTRSGLITGSIDNTSTTKRRISAVLTGGMMPFVLGYATGTTTTLRVLGHQ